MEQISTKEKILNTACALFSKKGFDSVGVQEIVDASGITKPTLYYYFGSKTGLLQALIMQKGEPLIQQIEKAAFAETGFVGALGRILRAELSFAKADPEFFRLHVTLLNAPKDSESYTLYSDIRGRLYELFLDFFVRSAAEFGNMRGKETLFSILFHNNIVSVAAAVLQGVISDDEATLFSITQSLVYGFASG